MNKILVTGGSGFIGTNLVDGLLAQGCEVLNIDIKPPRNKKHNNLWRKVDITDRDTLMLEVKNFGPEICFHMAARTDLDGKFLSDYTANTVGVKNIVDALKQCSNLRCAIFASSMLVCRIGYSPKSFSDYCPTTIYGQSKVIGENIVNDIGEGYYPWIIVRPTSIWGPWFASPYADFFLMVQKGHYFHPGNINIERSYGFVLNSVLQLISLSKNVRMHYKITYLADPIPINLKRWADTISIYSRGVPVGRIPLWIFHIIAYIGDVLKVFGIRNFPMSSFRLRNMCTTALYDVTELSNICGNLKYTPEEGVRITCDWIKKQDLI